MDGDLRILFRKNMPAGQWTTVETGGTAQGVPDSEFCFPLGAQGWVEHKKSDGWAVKIRPEQIGWILRRVRMGGRVFVAIRRKRDELWLVRGRDVEILLDGGLRAISAPLGVWSGGPGRWDWAEVQKLLVYSTL